ncbi:hypothetical protein [Candidatus Poriferisodalis sp.]|uniref:hypothetical protein n=1 Tax=Candidatus Poriferisodalis sp. TaxID=3101277 RepID=UPI003B022B3C
MDRASKLDKNHRLRFGAAARAIAFVVAVVLLAATVSPAAAQDVSTPPIDNGTSPAGGPCDVSSDTAAAADDTRPRNLTLLVHRIAVNGNVEVRTDSANTVSAVFWLRVAIMRDNKVVRPTGFVAGALKVDNGTVLVDDLYGYYQHVRFYEIDPDFAADPAVVTVCIPEGTVEYDGGTNGHVEATFPIGQPLTVELSADSPVAAQNDGGGTFEFDIRLGRAVSSRADDESHTSLECSTFVCPDISLSEGHVTRLSWRFGGDKQHIRATVRHYRPDGTTIRIHIPAGGFAIEQATSADEFNRASNVLEVRVLPAPLSIQGSTAPSVDSGFSGTVGTYSVGNRDDLSWSLAGPDSGDMSISESGELSFNSEHVYATGADSDGDDIYEVTVEAVDAAGVRSGSVDVTVTVLPLSIQGSTAPSVDSGFSGTVGTYSAGDRDDLSWSLTGPDSGDMSISESGELSFNSEHVYATGADTDGDDIYEVTVETIGTAGDADSMDVAITVRGGGPEIGAVRFYSSPRPNGVHAEGHYIQMSVRFDRRIVVTGEPYLELSVGDVTRKLVYGGVDYNYAFFKYFVERGDQDDDGVSLEANSLRLNGGSITGPSEWRGTGPDDLPAVLTHAAVADNSGYRVSAPLLRVEGATRLEVISGSSGVVGSYKTISDGTNTKWSLAGSDSEHMSIDRNGDLSFSGEYVYANEADSDGDNIYEVTVLAEQQLALEDGTVTIFAFRDVDVKVSAGGSEIESVSFHTIPDSRNAYGHGNAVEVSVRFNEWVDIQGQPYLELNIGGAIRNAVHDRTEGYSAIFRYEIALGDNDDDGISVAENSLRLNGGSITDEGLLHAPLTHSAVADDPLHKVLAPGGL